MKIEKKESFTKWNWSVFFIFPSISFYSKKTTIHNYDDGKIQNLIDLQVYFIFLWFTTGVNLFIMWGNKGEIKRQQKRKSLYKCSRCLSINIGETDQEGAGLCNNCDEVDYWEFIRYSE